MRNNPFIIMKQTGKINLAQAAAVGNATIKVSAAPFPHKDTDYYQIARSGEYVQDNASK